jgi:hypothetical protein
MARNPQRERELRRLAVLAAAVSGVALPVTGLAVHVSDHLRGWSMVHVVVGAVFVLAVGWHIITNRRALARYARGTN